MPVEVRPAPSDELRTWLATHWSGDTVVVHGTTYTADDLDGLVAESDGRLTGALTYRVEGDALEIVTADADEPRQGVGRALVDVVVAEAARRGVRRVWLTTTNDNLTALGFWQAMGFRLCALRPDAVMQARRLKSSIPLTGDHGLPIRDELDLERLLRA